MRDVENFEQTKLLIDRTQIQRILALLVGRGGGALRRNFQDLDVFAKHFDGKVLLEMSVANDLKLVGQRKIARTSRGTKRHDFRRR